METTDTQTTAPEAGMMRFGGTTYFGVGMAREGGAEDGPAVGYQAYQMTRVPGYKKGNKVTVGPVRETYTEARDDAWGARS